MSGDLIRRLRKSPGNEKLWSEWYKSVYPKVYYAAYRLTSGRAEAARDLTQETFSRFIEYRVLERVVDEARAAGYLIATCRNLAVDRNREAGRISLEGLEAAV